MVYNKNVLFIKRYTKEFVRNIGLFQSVALKKPGYKQWWNCVKEQLFYFTILIIFKVIIIIIIIIVEKLTMNKTNDVVY